MTRQSHNVAFAKAYFDVGQQGFPLVDYAQVLGVKDFVHAAKVGFLFVDWKKNNAVCEMRKKII